jgi:hypothetical protein
MTAMLPEGFTRWNIVAITSMTMGTLMLVFWQIYGLSETGIVEFLDTTRQLSFPMFLLSFLARPLYQIYSNPLTVWMIANRRYTRLAFAVICACYAIGCLGFKRVTGHWGLNGLIGMNGAIASLSLITLTSFRGIQRILPRDCKPILQSPGMYGIWAFFQLEFLMKAQKTGSWYDWSLTLIAFFALIIRVLERRFFYPRSAKSVMTSASIEISAESSIEPATKATIYSSVD